MQPVRFAIVSPARWGRLLLDAARSSDRLELAGACSRDPANTADVIANYGGRAFASLEEICAAPDVEAVLLPTPHHLHYRQAMAVLRAGKHAFVEKPIANTVAEAEALDAEAARRGLVIGVGMQGRRTGAVRKAKRMLDGGELGKPALVAALHGAPIPVATRDDWKHRADAVPGGPLDQLGVHYADILRYLFGPIEQVTGFVTSSVTERSSPDAACVSFLLPGGVPGSYVTQQVSAYVSDLSIYATRGALHIRRMGQELAWQPVVDAATAKNTGPVYQAVPFDGPHPFTTALQEELEDLACCIRTGGQPEVGAAAGIAALRFVRAALHAHATGRTVRLAP